MLQMHDTAGTSAIRAGKRRTKAPTTFTLLEPISEVNRLLVVIAYTQSVSSSLHAICMPTVYMLKVVIDQLALAVVAQCHSANMQ